MKLDFKQLDFKQLDAPFGNESLSHGFKSSATVLIAE